LRKGLSERQRPGGNIGILSCKLWMTGNDQLAGDFRALNLKATVSQNEFNFKHISSGFKTNISLALKSFLFLVTIKLMPVIDEAQRI
jgi:hypothetical protein